MSGRVKLRHGFWRWMWWKRLHPAAELTIMLLESAEGWRVDHFHLTHREAMVSMWIANRWYGFKIAINGREAGYSDDVTLDRWSKRILIAHVAAFLRDDLHRASSSEIAMYSRRVTRVLTAQLDKAA